MIARAPQPRTRRIQLVAGLVVPVIGFVVVTLRSSLIVVTLGGAIVLAIGVGIGSA